MLMYTMSAINRQAKWILLAALIAASAYILVNKNQKEGATVKILQIAEHPALDATRRGTEDYLKSCCKLTVDYETAQGDPTLALQIAQNFISSWHSCCSIFPTI